MADTVDREARASNPRPHVLARATGQLELVRHPAEKPPDVDYDVLDELSPPNRSNRSHAGNTTGLSL